MPEQTSEAGGLTEPVERPADPVERPAEPAAPPESADRPEPADPERAADPAPEPAPTGPTPAAPPTASRWSGALRLCQTTARTNWLFLIIFAVGLAGRVLTMIAYRPALMYIDSYRYLTNVYVLDPQSPDPLGYPVFLRGVLAFGHLGAVVGAQHLLGLGMGVCVYVILRRRNVPKTLAALASAPVLIDAYQWQIEQNILSDSLFLAMVTAALAVLAWRRRPSAKLAATAGLILGLAVTVRLVGEVMIFPALLFVVLAAGPTWKRRLQVSGALVLAFVIPVGGYLQYAHSYTGTGYSSSEDDNGLLYGRAATIADCATIPAEYKAICPTGSVASREALGPDYFATDAPYPVPLLEMHPFAWYVFEHEPVRFAFTYGRDFLQLYSSRRQTTFGGTDITRWQFQPYYTVWTADPNGATEELNSLGESGPGYNAGVARILIDYQLNGGYTPGWLFAAFALLGVAGALGFNRGARRSRLRFEALLWTGTCVSLLLLADFFEYSWRYQLPALVLYPVGGALGLCALLGIEKAPRPKLTAFPDEVDAPAVADFHERYTAHDLSAPVFIVIAAYNEENGIGDVLDTLPTEIHGLPCKPLVVVDGAADATAEVALAHGALTCVAPTNRGQGAALRLGYNIAYQAGAKYIVTTDADGQYDPEDLPALLSPLLDGTADFTTGSRILGQSRTGDHVRQLGCRVFATLVSRLMHTTVTDTSFGLRAMRADIPTTLTLHQPQYQSSELLIGILAHGYRVTELPMTINARGAGETKKGNNLVYGSRYARVVLTTWWRERRTRGAKPANPTQAAVGADAN